MASPIFQKLFIIILGRPADTEFGPAIEAQVSHEGWDFLIREVNAYLDAQADARGGVAVLQELAWNGFSYHLGDAEAAHLVNAIETGGLTWADLLAYAVVGVQGVLAETLSNRAAAAEAFTASLTEQDKDGFYAWNSGANLHGAAHNLLLSIGADDLTFEQGQGSLVALVTNLGSDGLGGIGSDGRIATASVFVDADADGMPDEGELADTTADDGGFDVDTHEPAGSLLLMGGTDILTAHELIGMLQAPAGATVVTALTSLAEALLDIDAEETALGASEATTTALGLPALNVLNYEPIATLADPEASAEDYDLALMVERVSIQLMILVNHLTVALMSTGEGEAQASQAAWAAAAQAAAAGTLDLTDFDAVEDIVGGAVGDGLSAEDIADIATVIVALNDAAEDADGIVELAKAAVVGGDAAVDLGDALDAGDGLDAWVIEYTDGELDEKLDGAATGFLLPGVPVDPDSGANFAPAGTDREITFEEDDTFTFSATHFGYSDFDGDAMLAVRIDTLPAVGSLQLDGIAVTAGQVIPAANIGLLTYEPVANANGDAYASLTFSVQDAQGAFDASPNTITFNVEPDNDLPTGSVTITGDAIVGQELTAVSTLADIDGIGTLSYEWFADGESLGETGSTLVLTEDEVGMEITVRVSYEDGDGTLESVESAATDPVDTAANNQPEGDVTITGTATQGQTLSASHDVTDADGMGAVSWQWYAGGVAIDGATDDEFTLTQAEVGKVITVVLSYTDGEGNEESVESGGTSAVANVNDAPTLTDIDDFAGTEDTPLVIGYDDLLGGSDADDADGDAIGFRIESISANGTLEIGDGVTFEAASAGMVVEDGDQLRWTPDADTNGANTAAFTVVATDGDDDSGDAVQVRVDVAAVNDAPTLDGSKSPVLTNVTETTGSPTPAAPANGTTTGARLISALVMETGGIANVTDIDSDTFGIAITSFNAASQGSLFYSTNGGDTWSELTTATAGAALLLDSNDYVIFKPDGGVGPQTINTVFTFKAWDQSTGTSGSMANTTGTAFSSTTDTVAVTITAAPAQQPPNDGTFGDGIDDDYIGGSGADTIVSGTGNDTLTGGGGSDYIDAGAGNDVVNGSDGGDTVLGGDGDDVIMGGNSSDEIRGGAGNDTITGGNSGDLIIFESTAAANGVDSISFDNTSNGNSQDVFDLPSSMVTAGMEAGGGGFVDGITPFSASSSDDRNIAGRVATYAGTSIGNVDSPADVADLFQSDDLSLAADGRAILITGTAGGNTAYMWYVVNDGDAQVTAAEVDRVAILTLTGNITDFDENSFAF